MLKRTPDVSIVMPFFGRLPLVYEAVTTALRQTGVETELLVVDDGTCDDVSELREYVIKSGGIFLSQPHGGIAAARNLGLAAASGDWVTFADSDDILYSNKLACQIAECRRANTVWSCTGFHIIDRHGRQIGRELLADIQGSFWRYACPFGSSAVVMRRDVLLAIGGFDESLERSEDWDLFIRLGEYSYPTILRRPLYAYRTDCENVTGRDADKWLSSWHYLAKKHQIEPYVDAYIASLATLNVRRNGAAQTA